MTQLTRLLASKPEDVINEHDEQRGASPAIYDMAVCAKDDVLYQAADIETALAALVLSHSVYNVKFARGAHNVLFYLQRYALGIDEGSKPPPKVLSFITKLNSLSSDQ